MTKILHNWFIALFALVCVIPLHGSYLDSGLELNGVIDDPECVSLNINNILDGTYQTYLNNLWENTFPGKKFLNIADNVFVYME